MSPTLPIPLLKKYFSNVFVETGFLYGGGVLTALECGCKEIHSFEVDTKLADAGKEKFKDYPNVHIYHADSGLELWDVIKDIKEQITFWIDAHLCQPNRETGINNCPLREEIKQIGFHPMKNHNILCDDVSDWGQDNMNLVTLKEVKTLILEVNPQYQFYLADGKKKKNDILVAEIL